MPSKFEMTSNPNKGQRHSISIWDSIEEYEDYDDLLKGLAKIGADDHVTLYVSTPGGRCDIGFMIIGRLESLPCMVDVIVPYPTYSMGAVMALCGDSLEVKSGAYLMFHDYITEARGKGNAIFKRTEAYKETFEYLFTTSCHPFLTRKECSSVLNGRDLYIKWNDPTLQKRIERHFR